MNAPVDTGETFLHTYFLPQLEKRDHIALAVASSGITAMHLTGGLQCILRLNFH